MGAQSALFPPIEPYASGFLDVGDGHRIYYEEVGNADGLPAVFLHGGPGGGIQPENRRFFDPGAYRIILFDQRGCGKSTPNATLEANTTWHLVGDIERLREHLGIASWLMLGGSWGSTLALAYAETYPERVRALILRGIFLLRPKELRWFYQDGANALFPDFWEDFVSPIPEAERGDMMSAYYRRLTSDEASVRAAAARAWSLWEGRTLSLQFDASRLERFGADEFAAAFARIECHYFINRGFFESDNQLLENIDRIRAIPAAIIQGRYDVVTPITSAWDLHRAWPEADFHIVPDAGHAATEPGIERALVAATERFKNLTA